jgi:acetolactate synthase-1/2/3 large subunit
VEKSEASDLLVAFAERFAIPVATTLRAKGVFPEDHRLSLGVFGYAGHRHAIETIISGEVEVLIVLGSGLSQRDTLFWDRKMLPSRALVHVDIEPEVIGRTWHTEIPVVGDCGTVLRRILESDSVHLSTLEASNPLRRAWLERIKSQGPRHYDLDNTRSDAIPLHPARVIAEMRRVMPRNSVLVVDSGAHRAFSGHYWEAFESRSYISGTNLGPMGWAIPAGIGAKLARPERPLAVITGDGCMLMHGVEIQTAARYKIPVIFVVINNGALGNVWLRAAKEGPGPAALTELPVHDWAGFARSLGLMADTVSTPGQIEPAFRKALEADAPYLLDIRCGREYGTPVSPFSQAKKEWVDDD